MRKLFAILLCFLMVTVALFIPLPAYALKYNYGTSLANVDASYIGVHTNEQTGESAAIIGDINGDGFADFLIGAPLNGEGGSNGGKAYLLFGNSTGLHMDTSLSTAPASFLGQADYGVGGNSAGVGDVNGDGLDDFIIGASPWYTEYLFFGNASGWKKGTSILTANVTFNGAGGKPKHGDVNGDGLSDILFSDLSANSPYSGCGNVHLVFGHKGAWASTIDLTKEVTFHGANKNDLAGSGLSVVGDVNADGYDDILIGAWGVDQGGTDAGAAYLIFGKASGWANPMNLSDANASFLGIHAGDKASPTSGAGDVNGDGYADFLIGAPKVDKTNSNVGETYLFYGMAKGWTKNVSLSKANATFTGLNDNDNTGTSLVAAGDVNGDGYDDFMIGDNEESAFLSNNGRAYLFLGSASGWKGSYSVSNANASFVGEAAYDYSGTVIDGNGDINGDGYPDLLIGSFSCNDQIFGTGQTYIIFPDHNTRPSSISELKAYKDQTFVTEVSKSPLDAWVFLQMKGQDLNSTHADNALVKVTSQTDTTGFTLSLKENGVATGVFQGKIQLKNATIEKMKAIAVSYEKEPVVISSVQDPSKNTTVLVNLPIKIIPLTPTINIDEDNTFTQSYSAMNGDPTEWNFTTNAPWLNWNSTSTRITGMPDNTEVGKYWAKLSVTDEDKEYYEQSIQIRVINLPPKIITWPIGSFFEDSKLYQDFNSSDDGQGNISWHFSSNAKWLSFDLQTGTLTGNIDDPQIGSYKVNISVDDGNGGWGYLNYTLKVLNVNDPPKMVGEDLTMIYQGQYYNRTYNVLDQDVNDKVFSWSLKTNASWLSINPVLGRMFGIPGNADVGLWYANVSVRDAANAKDFRNFTILVINVNDPPVILGDPTTEVLQDQRYLYDLNVSDIDVTDHTFHWAMTTDAKWLNMDGSNGTLWGTPDNDDVGIYGVNVTVSDPGGLTDIISFNISVKNVNDPPIMTSDQIRVWVLQDSSYSCHFNVTDPDRTDHIFHWSIKTIAKWLKFDDTTLTLSGVPRNSDVGTSLVNISVFDLGGLSDSISFNVTVINVNDPPKWAYLIINQTLEYQDILNVSALATDLDAGDKISYNVSCDPQCGLVIDKDTGRILWNANTSGKYKVTVTASDGDLSIEQVFTIIVKAKPTEGFFTGNKKPLPVGVSVIVIAAIAIAIGIAIGIGIVLLKRKKKTQPVEPPKYPPPPPWVQQ
jgi:hypothetical protein